MKWPSQIQSMLFGEDVQLDDVAVTDLFIFIFYDRTLI